MGDEIRAEQEVRVFERLMKAHENVHKTDVTIPSDGDKFITVSFYWKFPSIADLPDKDTFLYGNAELAKMSPKEQAEAAQKYANELAWVMVDKANKDAAVPSASKLTRAEWEELRNTYPVQMNVLAVEIVANNSALSKNFQSGRQTPH